MSFTQEAEARAVIALQSLRGNEALAAAVWAEVNAFFARHPELERTEFATAFIASLVVDQISEGGEPSQRQSA